MQINQYILYPDLDEKTITLYSKAKFGDVNSIKIIADEIVKKIKASNDIDLNKCVMYATNKSPVNDCCLKNSYIIARQVAESLNLEMWTGEYSDSFSMAVHYDRVSNRKMSIHRRPKIIDKSNIIPFDKDIIFFDDSTASGVTLQASVEELESLTNKIFAFFAIKIDINKYNENDINEYIWRSKEVDTLVKIIKQPGYIYTTQMIRTVDGLSQPERSNLMADLSEDEISRLEKAYKIHLSKDLM